MSRSTAIVIGAGMGGLAAARVLSEHFDQVRILERDQLTSDAETRRGVPQGRHAHALLVAGLGILDGWFPGLIDDVLAAGAIPISSSNGWWFQGGAYRARGDTGRTSVSMSRPLLENHVRHRVVALPNVTLSAGVSVNGLVFGNGGVTGVVTDDGTITSDLVADCSGRHTRLIGHLAEAGFAAPPESHIKIDMAYGTRLLARDDDFDGSFAVIVGNPNVLHRGAVMLPIEGDRWVLTLAGFHGDVPPTDDDGYLGFARSLPAPLVADVLARSNALSPVMTHRLPSSQRRHFEKLVRLPGGYVALGDAVCSFNPIYGQGMSSAALQAQELGGCLTRYETNGEQMARAFYRATAKVIANPWAIAAGADFANPQTTGPRSRGTGVVNRYLERVVLASHTSPQVDAAMFNVQNLVAPPPSLMRPAIMMRTLVAARNSPVRTGVPGRQPAMKDSSDSITVEA